MFMKNDTNRSFSKAQLNAFGPTLNWSFYVFPGRTLIIGSRLHGERKRTFCPPGPVIRVLLRWITDYQRGL